MTCDVPRCKRPVLLTYASFKNEWKVKDVKVCEYHWQKHCDEGDAFDLRVRFKPKEVVDAGYTRTPQQSR